MAQVADGADLGIAELPPLQLFLEAWEIGLRQVCREVERLPAVGIVEDEGVRNHAPVALEEGAVGQGLEGEGVADPGRQSPAEVIVVPDTGLVEGVGHTIADRDHVCAQRIQHIQVGHAQHLSGVLDTRTPGRQAQCCDQLGISEGTDPGGAHSREVLGYPVGGLEVQRLSHAFS